MGEVVLEQAEWKIMDGTNGRERNPGSVKWRWTIPISDYWVGGDPGGMWGVVPDLHLASPWQGGRPSLFWRPAIVCFASDCCMCNLLHLRLKFCPDGIASPAFLNLFQVSSICSCLSFWRHFLSHVSSLTRSRKSCHVTLGEMALFDEFAMIMCLVRDLEQNC